MGTRREEHGDVVEAGTPVHDGCPRVFHQDEERRVAGAEKD
jgi:hypothetical protein